MRPPTEKEKMPFIVIKDTPHGREADYKEIDRGLNSNDPNAVRQANLARDRIRRESGKVQSMREALIKAHRDGNRAEIADIHDFVERHVEYKND